MNYIIPTLALILAIITVHLIHIQIENNQHKIRLQNYNVKTENQFHQIVSQLNEIKSKMTLRK